LPRRADVNEATAAKETNTHGIDSTNVVVINTCEKVSNNEPRGSLRLVDGCNDYESEDRPTKCLCETNYRGLSNHTYVKVKPVRDCVHGANGCTKCCERDPLYGWIGYLPFVVCGYLFCMTLSCISFWTLRLSRNKVLILDNRLASAAGPLHQAACG